MSKNESHGQPCDIISIGGGRNGKSIRERKKRRKNHNKKGEADSLGNRSIWRLKRLWHSHIMEEKQMEMKGIALHRVKIIMGGWKLCKDLDKRIFHQSCERKEGR